MNASVWAPGFGLTGAIASTLDIAHTGTPTGAVTRLLRDKIDIICDVLDFGGKNDGTEDISGPFNAASAYLKTRIVANPGGVYNNYVSGCIVVPPGLYRIDNPLDLTGFLNPRAWYVMAIGATFIGNYAGTLVDLLSSRFCHWLGGTIFSPAAANVVAGMQIGRDNTSASAGRHYFEGLVITGTYSKACMYNYASESLTLMHPYFENLHSGAGSYTLICDGNGQVFKADSIFKTAHTTPVAQSFLSDISINGYYLKPNGGSPLFLARTALHRYLNSYVVSIDDAGVTLHCDGFGHRGLKFDIHPETDGLKHCVKFLGSSTCTVQGFKWEDNNNRAEQSTFYADPTVSSVIIDAAEIDIYGLLDVPTNGLFEDKSKFKVRGRMYLGQTCAGLDIAEFKGYLHVDDRTLHPLPLSGSYFVDDNISTHQQLEVGDSHKFPSTDFVPSVTCATPGDFSIGVPVTQTAAYTKEDGSCNVSIGLGFTPTWTTASGEIRIPLPRTAYNAANILPTLNVSGTNLNLVWPAGATKLQARVQQNQAYAVLEATGPGINSTILQVAAMPSGLLQSLYISGSYFTKTT